MWGVFIGYRLAPGGKWNDEYIVEDIEQIGLLDHSLSARAEEWHMRPHVSKRLTLGVSELEMPSKDFYERADGTLAGIAAAIRHKDGTDVDSHGAPLLIPGLPVPADTTEFDRTTRQHEKLREHVRRLQAEAEVTPRSCYP